MTEDKQAQPDTGSAADAAVEDPWGVLPMRDRLRYRHRNDDDAQEVGDGRPNDAGGDDG